MHKAISVKVLTLCACKTHLSRTIYLALSVKWEIVHKNLVIPCSDGYFHHSYLKKKKRGSGRQEKRWSISIMSLLQSCPVIFSPVFFEPICGLNPCSLSFSLSHSCNPFPPHLHLTQVWALSKSCSSSSSPPAFRLQGFCPKSDHRWDFVPPWWFIGV